MKSFNKSIKKKFDIKYLGEIIQQKNKNNIIIII